MQALNARLEAEAVDVSLPGRPEIEARLHPLSRTIEEVIAIFSEMGFVVAEGPDIESDYYNFTALNIPPEHPARQEHDTFYLPSGRYWATQGLANPYLACSNPHYGSHSAADPDYCARTHLPF